jgi:two-component system chemotaxis response regulator CheY
VSRVLIIDDAPFMRAAIRDILTGGGLEVAGEAADGDEGVHLYSVLRPDAVTMDIVMPRKDGLTALQEIMRLDPAARVVMCSAEGQEIMITMAIERGARDFIVKPFQPARVLRVVRSVLGLEATGRSGG